jgi:hypothetical protein
VPLAGYVVFLLTHSVPAAIVASFLVSSWESLSVPATFAVVGKSTEAGARTMAFALQSIQKRLPKIVGPLIGGFVVAALGVDARRARAALVRDGSVLCRSSCSGRLLESHEPRRPRRSRRARSGAPCRRSSSACGGATCSCAGATGWCATSSSSTA